MRGEHFLLLAEREQLLAPVVLVQLRGILAQQRRPATGEAVARLLVERGYLTVDQARHLINAGSGAGSPLVPQLVSKTSPLGQSASRTAEPHQSDELLLAPDPPNPTTRQVWQATTNTSAPPVQAKSNASPSSPLVPTDAALAELTDSLRQWMELPGPHSWSTTPSPIFAPPRFQVTPTMVLIGLGGVILLLILVILVALTR
jgi:hypothetical protein